MRRIGFVAITSSLLLAVAAAPALACGGLIGPRGSVNLLRTTTLAAYSGGFEHYLTSFEFAGGGGAFGSIVPLPGVPSKVEKGGRWTLQRLVEETQPRIADFAIAESKTAGVQRSARVILETRIDALDITILEGGGDEVGVWAKDNGFNLPPDAPEVLDFYAERSPIFMAARFDTAAAAERGQVVGDGTPIHLTIPTNRPWVPLRILGLGKDSSEVVQADVYLLTEDRPQLLPDPGDGMFLVRSEPASESLLDDLRSDQGMEWIPQNMWLSYLRIDASAGVLDYDLAVSVDERAPSRIDAGLGPMESLPQGSQQLVMWMTLAILALVMFGAAGAARRLGWASNVGGPA